MYIALTSFCALQVGQHSEVVVLATFGDVDENYPWAVVVCGEKAVVWYSKSGTCTGVPCIECTLYGLRLPCLRHLTGRQVVVPRDDYTAGIDFMLLMSCFISIGLMAFALSLTLLGMRH